MNDEQYPHGRLVARIEHITEIPMLVLTGVYLVTFLVSYLPHLPAQARAVTEYVEFVVIGLFAADLLIRVAAAEGRLAYLREHWLDVVIVVIPFLRPLRALRVLRLVPIILRAAVGLRRVVGASRLAYVLTTGVLAVLVSAALVTLFEGESHGTIKNYGDALWWALTTVTTVGYGDVTPVTAEGRAVAAFLMVVGIALFGVLTAGIAAYFVERKAAPEQEQEQPEVLGRLEALEARLEEQNRLLALLLQEWTTN